MLCMSSGRSAPDVVGALRRSKSTENHSGGAIRALSQDYEIRWDGVEDSRQTNRPVKGDQARIVRLASASRYTSVICRELRIPVGSAVVLSRMLTDETRNWWWAPLLAAASRAIASAGVTGLG
jgi:hypothetical protein